MSDIHRETEVRTGDERDRSRIELLLRPVREDPIPRCLQERKVEKAPRQLDRIQGYEFRGEGLPLDAAEFIRRREHLYGERGNVHPSCNPIEYMPGDFQRRSGLW